MVPKTLWESTSSLYRKFSRRWRKVFPIFRLGQIGTLQPQVRTSMDLQLGPIGILRLPCLEILLLFRKSRSGKAMSPNKRVSMVLGWMLDRLLDNLKEWLAVINSELCPMILSVEIIFTVPRCLWTSFSPIQWLESRLRQATTPPLREPQVLPGAWCLWITTRTPLTSPIQPSGGIWVLSPTSLKHKIGRKGRNSCTLPLRAMSIFRIQLVLMHTIPKISSSRLPSLHSSVTKWTIRRPRQGPRSRTLFRLEMMTRWSTQCSCRAVVAKVNLTLSLPGGPRLKATQHRDRKRGASRPTRTRVLARRAFWPMEEKHPRVAGKPTPWLPDPNRALSYLMPPKLCRTLLSMVKDSNRCTSQVRRK